MNELIKERKKIESIDRKMKKLFIKRMNHSLKVKAIKDRLNLAYFDKEREEFMKQNYSKDLTTFKEEYLCFLDNILKQSKEIMQKEEV